jgi:hypothetical protein
LSSGTRPSLPPALPHSYLELQPVFVPFVDFLVSDNGLLGVSTEEKDSSNLTPIQTATLPIRQYLEFQKLQKKYFEFRCVCGLPIDVIKKIISDVMHLTIPYVPSPSPSLLPSNFQLLFFGNSRDFPRCFYETRPFILLDLFVFSDIRRNRLSFSFLTFWQFQDVRNLYETITNPRLFVRFFHLGPSTACRLEWINVIQEVTWRDSLHNLLYSTSRLNTIGKFH